MLIRFVKRVLSIALYMLISVSISIVAIDYISLLTGIACIIIAAMGFIPFFIWIEHRIFFWPAQNGLQVTEGEILQILNSLTVDGFLFELIQFDHHYILKPHFRDQKFSSFLNQYHINQMYYMQIWMNTKQHTVYFKDHLITLSTSLLLINQWESYHSDSGLIYTPIYMIDDHNKLVILNSDKLHDSLINAITNLGWNVRTRVY
ncbi:hypothetical protein [Celerinatantimonas sp. YJH-8]|uniref:hypothetical protein n=1 Tax=Celerinatantimonas sp. YJH-8 TaxID=3228714 RepID=UPI0038C2BE53